MMSEKKYKQLRFFHWFGVGTLIALWLLHILYVFSYEFLTTFVIGDTFVVGIVAMILLPVCCILLFTVGLVFLILSRRPLLFILSLLQTGLYGFYVVAFTVFSPYETQIYHIWFAFLVLFTACWLWYSFRQIKNGSRCDWRNR